MALLYRLIGGCVIAAAAALCLLLALPYIVAMGAFMISIVIFLIACFFYMFLVVWNFIVVGFALLFPLLPILLVLAAVAYLMDEKK